MAQKTKKNNIGAPRQFPFTLEETQELFEQYQKETYDNTVVFPSWPDFLSRINVTPQEADEVILNPVDTNKRLSEYLKKALGWCMAQLFSNPNWMKKPVAAIYLSKQKFGGYCYTDKQEVKQDTKMEVNVKFGSKLK
jgi:hypothetical protein